MLENINLTLGAPAIMGRLATYPVFREQDAAPDLIELDEALATGKTSITEVSESGQVPVLVVKNGCDRDLILYDGEELVGAKQNRIANMTVIVGAGSELHLPVSCVERGRWSWKGRHFKSSDSFMYPSLRRNKFSQVSDSLDAGASFAADQSRIWEDIGGKARRMNVQSSTEAMQDITRKFHVSDQELAEQIPEVPGQVGYLAFIRGGLAGMDVFASTRLCRSKLYKLLRSYYLDSFDRSLRFPPVEASQVLLQIQKARCRAVQSPGIGDEYRFHNDCVEGAVTYLDGQLVHLTAFPARRRRREPNPGRRSRVS